MPTPTFSADDYLSALQSLLPRGRVWPRDAHAPLTGTLTGLSPVYARQTARAAALLVDAFPSTTHELLPEWQATMGLPDTCTGAPASLQDARNQVVAKLTAVGAQSARYFVNVAAAMGYTITTRHYAPFRAGQSRCGQQLGTYDWMYTWSINAPLNTVTSFRSGQSTAGEALSVWGNNALECALQRLAAAHTVLQFHYA